MLRRVYSSRIEAAPWPRLSITMRTAYKVKRELFGTKAYDASDADHKTEI